jgi:ribose transport system substrate-binding protein
MIKKTMLVMLIMTIAFSLFFLGCKSDISTVAQGESSEEVEKSFVPADDLEAPRGKDMYVLPVDMVAEEEVRIAFLLVENNPFCRYVKEGVLFAEEVLADRNGSVDIIALQEFDPKVFEEAMQNCITAQYDAICLFGLSEALTPVVNKAVDEGILVNVWNTEPGTDSKRNAFWGMDDYEAGKKCGTLLEDAMGGEGKYAIITGSFNVLGHELRRTGAREILDPNDNMELIGEFENEDKAEEAYNVTQNLLVSNPDIGGIYVTAGGPHGAARAIKDAGLTGEVKLVAHDWTEETVAYIRSGEVSACIDQDPFNQGFAPTVSAFNQIVAGIEPDEVNFFEGNVATPENVEEKVPEGYFE